MKATMKDLISYAELSRKLKEVVTITIFGNEDDEFTQVTLSSGNSSPMISMDDELIACELTDDGWFLVRDFHLNDCSKETLDDVERRFLINHTR